MEKSGEAGRRAGILGSGRMGRAMGAMLAAQGWSVVFGSRDPARAGRVAESVPGPGLTRGGSYAEAAAFGEVVVLTTLWSETEEILDQVGALDGKIVLDCTNPESPDGRSLTVGHTTSGAEEIARRIPGARVVKGFNHVYAELIDEGPGFGEARAGVFLCADDEAAKKVVADLARRAGFTAVDAGPLENARYTEPAAQLMVQLVRRMGLPPADVALSLIRRGGDAGSVVAQ